MTNRPQPGTGETQEGGERLQRVDVIREPVRGLHQGQRRTQLHQQPNT